MNPLQDITNRKSPYEPVSDEELLNSMQVLSFSPTRRNNVVNNNNGRGGGSAFSSASSASSGDDSSSASSPSSPFLRRVSFQFPTSPRRRQNEQVPTIKDDTKFQRFPSRSRPVSNWSPSTTNLNCSSIDEADLDTSASNCSCSCTENPRKQKKRASKRASLPLAGSTDLQNNNIFKRLHPDSQEQLIDLVCDVSKNSLTKSYKSTEGCDLIIRLSALLQNIKKALPERVYGHKRDAVTYRRVEIHLLMFKQECLKQCRFLFDEAQWLNLLDYILTAAPMVNKLPVWENTSHNLHREQIFRVMVSYCRKVVKVAGFHSEELKNLQRRFEACCRFSKHFAKLLTDLGLV